jgi:hypothetical protein
MHDQDSDSPLVVEADRGDLPRLRSKRRRGVTVTSAAAVALGLALAGGSVAAATTTGSSSTPSANGSSLPGRPPTGGSPPTAVGTVKSVGDDTFVLTEPNGTTVTVDVTSTTTYRDPKVSSASFADVTVGQQVAVFGTESDGSVAATSICIGLPPGAGKGGPGGPPGSHSGAPPEGAPAPGAAKSGTTPPTGAPTGS